MKTLIFVIIILNHLFCWNGRNEKLHFLADKTWLNVCKYNGASEAIGGSSEVPWAYDANSKVFVRVGGCTGGYTNAIVLFDMGTETVTTPWGLRDMTGPSDRPGGGCNRGIAYDPVTKCIFEAGGGASSDFGVYGYWRGDMAARTWTHYRDGSLMGQGQVAADTANRVIINTFRKPSGMRYCTLYFPDGDSLVSAPVRPGSGETELPIYHDWWPTMEYAPSLDGTMYFGYMWQDSTWGYYRQQWFTWLFDAHTRTWTDLKTTGLEAVPETYVSQGPRPTLSWDNAAGVMLLHISGVGLYVYNEIGNAWEPVPVTNPQILSSQMFDYDDEHNVHVLADYNFAYDQDVWAFRYSGAETPAEARAASASVFGLACSPNPLETKARIAFKLGYSSKVELSLYDVRGCLQKTILKGTRPAGIHETELDRGSLTPGHYILKLRSGSNQETRNVLILK